MLGSSAIADPNDIRTALALGRLEASQLRELIEERRDVDAEHFTRIHDAIRADREEIAKLRAQLAEHAKFIAAIGTAKSMFWGALAIIGAAAGVFFGFKKWSEK